MKFLRAGLMMCAPSGAVYSLNKTSTRAYIAKTAASWGAQALANANERTRSAAHSSHPPTNQHSTRCASPVLLTCYECCALTSQLCMCPRSLLLTPVSSTIALDGVQHCCLDRGCARARHLGDQPSVQHRSHGEAPAGRPTHPQLLLPLLLLPH